MKNLIVPLKRYVRFLKQYLYILTNKQINIVVGAAETKYNGWLSTNRNMLDITKEKDFKRFFYRKKINKILAEHVLEHLNDQDLKLMTANFLKYASNDINIRIAVPDGFHSDAKYIDWVKPNGTGAGSDDHKHLFNYKTLSKVFEDAGFKSHLIEYWDEKKVFHSNYKNDKNGYIDRSFLNDERNKDGNPNYTSLIIDFTK